MIDNKPIVEQEIWKPINGYEGYYSASSHGRIKRDRKKDTDNGKILKPSLSNYNGYFQVSLSKQNKCKTLKIHSLVCLTFLGKKSFKQQINHKNGNKTDNKINNLEYCSASENTRHSFRLGLSNQKGDKNNYRKYICTMRMVPNGNIMDKICSICYKLKSKTEFNKNNKSFDGLDGRCRSCYRQRRTRFENHKHQFWTGKVK